VVSTTLLAMLGPGYALRGPDGSMHTAVDAMVGEYRNAFFAFLKGLLALHGAAMSYSVIMLKVSYLSHLTPLRTIVTRTRPHPALPLHTCRDVDPAVPPSRRGVDLDREVDHLLLHRRFFLHDTVLHPRPAQTLCDTHFGRDREVRRAGSGLSGRREWLAGCWIDQNCLHPYQQGTARDQ
jgi:hypothetical protein